MKKLNNLSSQWLRLAQEAIHSTGHEVSPAVVTIDFNSTDDFERDLLRNDMDRLLDRCRYGSTESVAATIFPYSLWNPKTPRTNLFDRYFAILPRVRKYNPRGVYFERMISYPGAKNVKGFNQLDHVISTYLGGNHRRSALQLSLVDPKTDLNTNAPVLGFPCLHQVGFLPKPRTKTLSVIAYYPMQYLLRRAYGNYLGLIRLGIFVGQQIGFRCNRLMCVAGVATIETHISDVGKLVSAYADA